MKWFISDLHWAHKNVINYCNRPYSSVEEMNEAIVNNWNAVVKSEDIVYVLGDLCLNPKWADLFVPQLNGTKILIPGNHDAQFAWKGKVQKGLTRALEVQGFKEVHQTLKITLKDGKKALLSHLPYSSPEGTKYDDRYIEYRPVQKHSTDNLLHGHVHCRYVKFNNMIDVGFDHQFRPYSEDEIIELLNDPRDFIPSRITDHYKFRDKVNDPNNTDY